MGDAGGQRSKRGEFFSLGAQLFAGDQLLPNPQFVQSHPALRDCLVKYPLLARVLALQSVSVESK